MSILLWRYLMMSERVKRNIEGLLTEVEDAIRECKWEVAYQRANAVLTLDKNNNDAKTYISAARRGLAMQTESYLQSSIRPDLNVVKEKLAEPIADPDNALYYSIPAAAVAPSWGPDWRAPWKNWGSVAQFGHGEYGGEMWTSVHLLDGVRIWGWRAWARGEGNSDHPVSVRVRLLRYELGESTIYEIGQEKIVEFNPGDYHYKRIFQTNLDHTIDNSKYAYMLSVRTPPYWVSENAAWWRGWFHGAIIIYLRPE
jgi:hypothetical protein